MLGDGGERSVVGTVAGVGSGSLKPNVHRNLNNIRPHLLAGFESLRISLVNNKNREKCNNLVLTQWTSIRLS